MRRYVRLLRPFQVKRIVLSRLEKKWPHLQKQLPTAETAEEAEAQKILPVVRKELQKLQTTVAGLKQRALKLQQFVPN